MIDQKVTYIVSDIDKAIAFEWIATHIREDVKLSFILLNRHRSELETFLTNRNIPVNRINIRGFRDYPVGIARIYAVLRKIKPDAIHCHLLHASITGLIAGFFARVRKRIYTRHHSTYNWEYNSKGIVFDRLVNWLSTDIVAISENVKNVLLEKEKVSPDKIRLIHHGFDLERFEKVDKQRVDLVRKKYGVEGKPVIGVVARWIEWKGIHYIIPAFAKLLKSYPDAQLLMANATGPYKSELEELLCKLPGDSYTIIPFENDLFALFKLFDIYIHTPINNTIEAFGQTYVEALAAGIPSVFTLSGVGLEMIEPGRNAFVVPYQDSDAICEAARSLLEDGKLRQSMIREGRESVRNFSLASMIHQLEDLYALSPANKTTEH